MSVESEAAQLDAQIRAQFPLPLMIDAAQRTRMHARVCACVHGDGGANMPRDVAGVCASYAALTPDESRRAMRERVRAARADHVAALGDHLASTRFADANLTHEWMRLAGVFGGDPEDRRSPRPVFFNVFVPPATTVCALVAVAYTGAHYTPHGNGTKQIRARVYSTGVGFAQQAIDDRSELFNPPRRIDPPAREAHTHVYYDRLVAFEGCRSNVVGREALVCSERARTLVDALFARAFPDGYAVVEMGNAHSHDVAHSFCVAMCFTPRTDAHAVTDASPPQFHATHGYYV
jgi:hypothetical protein